MSKYLLPCKCGKAIAIDTSQAGQQLICECGAPLEVPTLRGVRELEPIASTSPSSRPATEWNSSRGAVFAASLILVVIGAAASYFGYDALRKTPNITRQAETESFDKAIDDMSLDEVYEVWKVISTQGLGAQGQNAYVKMRSFRTGRQRMLVVGIVLIVGGLLGAVGATLGLGKSP